MFYLVFATQSENFIIKSEFWLNFCMLNLHFILEQATGIFEKLK